MKILRQKEFGIKDSVIKWLKGQTEGDKRRKEKTVEKLSKHKLTNEELDKLGLDWIDVERVDVDRADVNRTDVKRNSTGYKSSRLNTLEKEGKLYKEAKKAAKKNQLGKAAMIALPVAATVGTSIAVKKHKKKKENKK